MSIDKNTAQQMLTIRVEVLGGLRRVLQLLSAEDLIGIQHHLVKHVLRLVQVEFFISPVVEEIF